VTTAPLTGPGGARATAHLRPAPPPVCAQAVTRVDLTDFRSYARLRLDVVPRPVVLYGANGAGKTNVLEALSFLAPGRGLRRARLSEVARREVHETESARAWAVAAKVATPDGEAALGTGREPAAAGARERRQVRIDGSPARGQPALAEILGIAWLTPEQDRLFVDGAGGRRRFLDRLVTGFDPAQAGRLAAYEQALRERARLLRDGPHDPAWLTALEETMAERGVAIAAARREAVARLDQAARGDAGAFPAAGLALDGDVEGWLGEGPALAAEDRLRAALAESRRRDAEAGGATAGPHKSDLQVTHLGRGRPAAECSTGEQKALLIAVLLVHARLIGLTRGAPPVLLLDEVAAHLDARRREALYDRLCALGAQAWLTGTDRALFDGLDGRAQFRHVADGKVEST